jgi:hypothetical protein
VFVVLSADQELPHDAASTPITVSDKASDFEQLAASEQRRYRDTLFLSVGKVEAETSNRAIRNASRMRYC